MEQSVKNFIYADHNGLAYGIKKYVIDDEAGVEKLPTDAYVGSSCLVISTSNIYIINSKGKWIKQKSSSSGGGSEGGSTDPVEEDDEAIYDGGEVE